MEAFALSRARRLPESRRLLRLAGDDRLVALIRAGSEAAFEVVYERYHRPLLSFCRHLLGNAEDAAEAVQHTFLSAYRDLIASEKPIHLRPWLFTIARNGSMSLLRVRREHADVDDVQPATEGLAAEVQRREDLQELLGDLARLPEDQRAALVLAEIGSLSHEEIAQVLGCPEKKVKALVFQARTSLSASRAARDLPCQQVREQLANQHGGALRRDPLRRHVNQCTGCRDFRDEVRRQRQAFALILPVVPAAGLKGAVLSALGAGGAGSGAVGAGTVAATGGGGGIAAALSALGTSGMAVKALVAATVIGGLAAGGAAVTDGDGGGRPSHPSPARAAPLTGGSSDLRGLFADPVAELGRVSQSAATPGTARRPTKSHPARGNSAAAHRRALSRGRGHKRGLLGTQPRRSERSGRDDGTAAGRASGETVDESARAPTGAAHGRPRSNAPPPSTVAPDGAGKGRVRAPER